MKKLKAYLATNPNNGKKVASAATLNHTNK